LYQYGIKDRALEWFRSYLDDRTQQVKFDNKWSGLLNTEHSVPEGSVLSPLLFIIYTNNIMEVCPDKCNIKMFADDTLIYESEDNKELEHKMNVVLNIIEKWLSENKLKMNAEKIKCIIMRSIRKELRDKIILKCSDGTQIERNNEIAIQYYYR